jgi:hypothetical protein
MKNNQNELTETQELLLKMETQSEQLYSQINKLLLWKSALKVKVNESCENKTLVGKEGYICDLFPNGFTVWCPQEDNFYRFDADYLDIIGWDDEKFKNNMEKLEYVQIQGVWTHKSQIKP